MSHSKSTKELRDESADRIAVALTEEGVYLHIFDYDTIEVRMEQSVGFQAMSAVSIYGLYDIKLINRFSDMTQIELIVIEGKDGQKIRLRGCYVEQVHLGTGVFGADCFVGMLAREVTIEVG